VFWAVFIAAIFTALLLYIVDWRHFSSLADRIVIEDLIIAFGLLLLSNVIRSFRFCTLDHVWRKLPPWLVINNLYNFMTATLPGGIGDVATAYFLKRYSEFNILSAFRILLLSRIMDLAGMSALLLLVAIQVGDHAQYRATSIWISGALVLITILSLIPAVQQWVLEFMQKLPGQSRVMKKAHEKIRELTIISREYYSRNTFRISLFQTMLSIIATALSMHYILRSFEVGFTPLQSFFCVSAYAIFQMIPIQGIAGIGTQPVRWVAALKMAGYKGPDSVALSIFLHGTFYVFIAIIGLSTLLVWGMTRKA
jgi:hypothetical protein